MPLAIHARAKSDLAQKRDGAGLQHAGANPRQHVGAALPFQHDAVDAVAMENMRQKQAGRTTADDRHLGSRRRFHCRWDSWRALRQVLHSQPIGVCLSGGRLRLRRLCRQLDRHLLHVISFGSDPIRFRRLVRTGRRTSTCGISDKGRSKRLTLSQPLIRSFGLGAMKGRPTLGRAPQNRSKSGSFAMIDRDPPCFIARQLLHRSAHEPCALFSIRVRVHVPSEQIYRSRA